MGFGDDDFDDIGNDDDRFNFHDSYLLLTILMMLYTRLVSGLGLLYTALDLEKTL